MKIDAALLASNNRHKKIEIAAALPGLIISLPADKGIEFDVEETGATFLDNALLKARALFAAAKTPVIADDSGLCVASLDGRPGVYSARFGFDLPAPPADDAERNAYLLSLLPRGRRHEAFFVCAMVLLLSEYRFFAAQETVEGLIVHEPRGSSGFGYDPVFFVPEKGKTIAELPLEDKNSFSHRGRAAARIRANIESL
ncbi:MAG: RdgB/HAM1 family non-canonical purine NTP pyrophosphatase [Spirochaetales bacterium]|nr:RdgB/HAM1 family non-canonical purine NTP pyrophosphatase [Spirochaetales bacterium]